MGRFSLLEREKWTRLPCMKSVKYCRNSAKKTLRLVKIPSHDLMNGVFVGGATDKNEGEDGQQKAIKYPALTTRFRMQQGAFC